MTPATPAETPKTPRYWLMKSEPESYGIDHLKADKKTPWTGVRNYQARNSMQAMQLGDPILFYHSSCPVPGVYGLAKVASAHSYPDPTQFDPASPYYEPRATKDKPVWCLVDVAFVEKFVEPVTLTQIKANPKLHSMQILKPGSRLSVTEVTKAEFEIIKGVY